MAKTPRSPKTWLQRVRRFLGLTKNRGGAKVGHAGPGERTLGPPPPPPHVPAVVAAVAVDEAKAEANKGRRRRRRKNKNKDEGTINSPDLKQEGLGDPASQDSTLESLAPPVIIAATQELPTAETDTYGWQLVEHKKRHGGRAERPAQGLALEHDAIPKQTTAEHRHGPKKQQPRWTAGPSHQTPQHHAHPSPPCPASTPSKSTPPRIAAQHGKREEDDDDLGIKRMDQEEDSERQEETDDEEYNGREEDDEMHLSYWIKNKEIKSKDKSKTLCLICYLERRDPVPEIANKENEIERHLRKVHKMQKRKGHWCQSKGCWVRARNRRDLGRHQHLCHNL